MWWFIFGLLALSGLIHQHLIMKYIFGADMWFDWGSFWHHEPLIGMFFALAVWELVRPFLQKIWVRIMRRMIKHDGEIMNIK